MKKLFALLLILACSASLFGCSLFGDDDEDGEGDALQIVETAYITYPEATTLELSYTDGLYNYFIFKVGEVECVPLAYYDNPQRHTGLVDTKYTWSDTTITSDVLRESETMMTEFAVSHDVTSSVSSGIEASATVEGGGVSAGLKTTMEAKLQTHVGTESTISTSSETAKEISAVCERRQEKSFVIEKSCPVGYYRYAVCTTCEVYVAIACNTKNNTYSVEYITTAIGDKYDSILYSERSSLNADVSDKLTFDSSAISGMDLFGPIENIGKTAVIDLTAHLNENGTRLSDFSGGGYSYSASTGVLELKGTDAYQNYSKFIIRGNYGKLDSNGHVIKNHISWLCFNINTTHDITVELESVGAATPTGRSMFSTPYSTQDVEINLISAGLNNMLMVWGSDDDAGFMLGDNDLSISGYAPLTIKGEAATKDGADGIVARSLKVDLDADLIIHGGNGANGESGAGAGNGNPGNDGDDGGDGGWAVNVTNFSLLKCKRLELHGGNGGHGGSGSKGNNSVLGTAQPGGNGGDGGWGGWGLEASACEDPMAELARAESYSITGGDGGNGGNGGKGGGDTKVGRGGNGGDGGLKGYAIGERFGSFLPECNGIGGLGGDGGHNSNDPSKDGNDGADMRGNS